jgi:thioredoxin 1
MVQLIHNASEVPTSGVVVIDFFATWCGPCKTIAPAFADFGKEYPKVTFLKADVDVAEVLASKYNVSVLPTFVFLKDGAVINRIEGADIVKLKKALSKATA